MQQCNIPITTSSIKIQISHCIFHKFAYLFDVPLLPYWYSLWHPTQLFIWHPTQLIWELLKSQASPFDIAHVTCFLLSTTTTCKTLSLLNFRNLLSQTFFYTFTITIFISFMCLHACLKIWLYNKQAHEMCTKYFIYYMSINFYQDAI